ncbi:tetratricopeptide repeat protein [Chloroflexi bacterium TSY]|nr:tetratricopeptide repeat protein [Chloroflexi bacterium TSY]
MTKLSHATHTLPGQSLGVISDTSFTQLVNAAFKSYQNTLALSRSPLADSDLITPTLVRDNVSPTVEERGRGLRQLLHWAVAQIAPGSVQYPLGTYRPFDDPTWSEPLWWRYNILRHRYLEPLHPDDFVEGGRYTETLIALTGIPNTDTFFDERTRAIRDVTQRLRQQLIDGAASEDLQRIAIAEVLKPLKNQSAAQQILEIASIFDDIFLRQHLIGIAVEENVQNPKSVLEALITDRYLLTDDSAQSLWLSPVLRTNIYNKVDRDKRKRVHRIIARYYASRHEPLHAAKHWYCGEQFEQAAHILLAEAEELISELQIPELCASLCMFSAKDIPAALWSQLQIVLSDVYRHSGAREDALAACRNALKSSIDQDQQAKIYRRMGKLYENYNQLHALSYYQKAEERFANDDPELIEMLKDRSWVHIIRTDWSKAEEDLQKAIKFFPVGSRAVHADVYDALASVYRQQEQYDQAIQYAQNALALREESGDLIRVAKSLGNLGLIYRAMGEFKSAIAAYREAMATYTKLNNQELTAIALKNIGAVYFFDQNYNEAIANYQASLMICEKIGLPRIGLTAHYNLSEAYVKCDQKAKAGYHWQTGYAICQKHDFDDWAAAFITLKNETPLLADIEVEDIQRPTVVTAEPDQPPQVDDDEQSILDLAEQQKRITPKTLMDANHVSKATATRRLTALVERGLLEKHGKGRGTYYVRAESNGDFVAEKNKQVEVGIAPSRQIETHDSKKIRTQLHQQREWMENQYDVKALAMRTKESRQSDTIDLLLRFRELPDLITFFELEQRLCAILKLEVNLKLDNEPMDTNAKDVTKSAIWLWS